MRRLGRQYAKYLSNFRNWVVIGVILSAGSIFYVAWFTHMFDITATSPSREVKQVTQPVELQKPAQVQQPVIPAIEKKYEEPPVSPKVPEHEQQVKIPPQSRDTKAKRQSPHTPLPGGKLHPILSYSDEELGDTPVDAMMSGYGRAQGGKDCEADFGNGLIQRWRNTKKTHCANDRHNKESLSSSIDCYLMHQNHHHGNGDNLCVYHQVAIDIAILGNDAFTSPVMQQYVSTRHVKQPYPPYPQTFIEGVCGHKPDWNAAHMPGWNVDLTVKAYTDLPDLPIQETCHEYLDHTILMVERDTFANFYHDSEDFVNVFLAMAILGLRPSETEVWLMDLYPEGPFWDMWSAVYSHNHHAMTSFHLKQRYGSIGAKRVCARQAVVGIYGPAAPTTIMSWDIACTHSALVRAYSDYVIRSLGLHGQTHYALDRPSKTVTVTYMSRRASKEWPEKKFCNDTASFFLCRYWQGFGPRQLGRMVSNDAAVVKALQSLETESYSNGATVKVQAVDFNVLSFTEQIAVDVSTDIMVGPHGAGLTHSLFMRDRGTLLELFVDGSSANRHFHNLAFWYGRRYEGVGASNPVDTQDLLNKVRNLVNTMDLNSY